VIGENIHATRIVLRRGKHVTVAPDGQESVAFTATTGETRYLVIPEQLKARQDYQEGRVKHVGIAVRSAMSGDEAIAQDAMEYLRVMIDRQVKGGADYLDLNVDEVSVRRHEQLAAMQWLVRFVEAIAPVPLAIDSSNFEIIKTGIDACEGRCGSPMLNSASLERREALDLTQERGLPVIVTAAGESGMPQNTEERVANASQMIDLALSKGVPINHLYVDALVFPISVDIQFGNHYLEAIRALRAKYGEEIHLTGGLSNVSFGLPCRRVIGEAFMNLAVEAGVDSGIIDPVTTDLNSVFLPHTQTNAYQLARDMLLGLDRNCKNFLRAYRKGELAEAVAG
jgi:5-methyltetrahydrofolate--homocysteine methyltransferase